MPNGFFGVRPGCHQKLSLLIKKKIIMVSSKCLVFCSIGFAVPGVPVVVLLSSVAGKPVLSHRNLPVGKKE